MQPETECSVPSSFPSSFQIPSVSGPGSNGTATMAPDRTTVAAAMNAIADHSANPPPMTMNEVNPTLYEELKLRNEGAGFKRLVP